MGWPMSDELFGPSEKSVRREVSEPKILTVDFDQGIPWFNKWICALYIWSIIAINTV